MTFAEWGDLQGWPVFSLHGTPGSRLGRHPDEDVYVRAGVRLVTYDRPGYGGSDRLHGRAVVDCVVDVAAIADHLRLARFSVIGGSGGGSHSLAVGARLPDRVHRVTCNVGSAPFGAPELDWFEGMDPMNVREFGWALQGEAVLAPRLEAEAAADLRRMADDPSKMLGDEWELSDADRAVLARPEFHQVAWEQISEAHRGGVGGWVDDDLALVRAWGFGVSELRLPVRVVYGAGDVLVPALHGEWLAQHVPGCEVVREESLGHLGDPDLIGERLGWLTDGV